ATRPARPTGDGLPRSPAGHRAPEPHDAAAELVPEHLPWCAVPVLHGVHVGTAQPACLNGDDYIIGSGARVGRLADRRPGLLIHIQNGPHWLPRLSLAIQWFLMPRVAPDPR